MAEAVASEPEGSPQRSDRPGRSATPEWWADSAIAAMASSEAEDGERAASPPTTRHATEADDYQYIPDEADDHMYARRTNFVSGTPHLKEKHQDLLSQRIQKGELSPLPGIYSRGLKELITSRLHVNPTYRPKFVLLSRCTAKAVNRLLSSNGWPNGTPKSDIGILLALLRQF